MTSQGIGFALAPAALRALGRKRARGGTWLLSFSVLGLLFGTFWMFWGVIVFLTGVGLRNGVIVFLFGGVGPNLGASLMAWAAVRRRREAEELEQLAIYAEQQTDLTSHEAAHLLCVPHPHANQLLQLAASKGAAQLVQSSGLRPALPMGPDREKLVVFRRARRRRALWLAVAAVPVLGFATLWIVVGVAGIATGEWVIGLILLIPGGLFPLAGSIVLANRALRSWRRAAWAARLAAIVSTGNPRDLEHLAERLGLKPRDTRSVAAEALDLGIVPRDRLARLLSPAAATPSREQQLLPATPEGWLGRTLGGSWRVDALLAQGGMGAVYRTTHVPSGRQYALKIMLPDVATGPEALRRFEQEAHAASQLGHAGIATIHELGHIDERTAYLVMDLLEGETLEARLQRLGCLPWQEALHIALQVGDALSCAHDAGLLHRDLKPANVFLARTPTGERAMLLDFGLVKHVDSTEESRRTSSGVVAGTPLYMSPEQARGEALDVRSDLYGLAVVTYEMIAGVPPFFDKTVAEVYARLLREAAPALGRFAPGGHPAELERVLAQALATAPEQRPENVRVLLAQLSSLATEHQVLAG